MSGVFRIGTSNIVVPGTKQTFPAAFQTGTRLHYYSSLFNSLEVNSSFYKVPMPSTFGNWSRDVPADFRFSVKLWKNITHAKALDFNPSDILKFMSAADCLKDKKGCLLIQFPGGITSIYATKVKRLLEEINRSDPHDSWRLAVEFRHNSWYQKETYTVLNNFNATLVLHDIPKSKMTTLQTKSNFVFLRFHGILGDYKGSYSDEFLVDRAAQIKGWLKSGKDVYAYFNNTIGDAFQNARSLWNYINIYES